VEWSILIIIGLYYVLTNTNLQFLD